VTFQMTSGQNLNFAAPANWIEKMRSTKGNGIIGKLTARRDPGKDDSLTGNLPGSWSCKDTLRGAAFDIDFDAGGMVEVRKGKTLQQGHWRLTGRRIEIMGQNGPAFWVEHLSQEKLILNFDEGWRATCERR
jgi:serine protease Do